jgi:PKD repeat protein
LQTVVAVAVLGSGLCFATGVDFTWTPTNPVAGQPVSFFDTSTATPTSWSWNFGDGGTSSQQDPVHTYSGPGTFTVTLSIGSPFGSIFRSKPITVTASGAPPSARFSWSPADPVEGVAVRFSDTSTGSPTSWSWQFGDGGTSSARSPEHTYTIPRTYMVSLTVSNASGTDTVSRNLTVQSATYVPPVVDAGEFVYTIPASAHAPGEANTSWVTDVVLHNAGSSPANAYVYFLQRLQDNTGAIGRPVAVPPGRSVQIDDAVASLFGHSSATGALRVGSDRAVVVSSRTYNDASDGTFGQYIPGGPNWRTVRAGEAVYLIQLTNNQDFRTNIGFANVTVTAVTISVQIFSANGG